MEHDLTARLHHRLVCQFIEHSPKKPATKPRKSRSKAKSTAPGSPSLRALTKASIRVKSEPNQAPYEPINLEAFPQDLARETPSETNLSSPPRQPSEASMNVKAAEEAHDDTVDQAVDEAVGEAVEQAVDQPRKRPRAPIAGSVNEEVRCDG